jgi:hypothetical protein
MARAERGGVVEAAGAFSGHDSREKGAENELGKAWWKLRKLNKRNE